MALGDDGSCKEAGLPGNEIGSVHLNNQGWATPKLHRNERKDPSLIAGIYENNFLAPTYERNLCNGGFGSLAIPWGKINATSLSLKSLEGFIEHEKVEMKLITKKKKKAQKEDSGARDASNTLVGAQTANARVVSSKANRTSRSSFSRLRTLTGLRR